MFICLYEKKYDAWENIYFVSLKADSPNTENTSFCILCQCCQCLWIVHSWLLLRFSLTFIFN